MHYVYKVTNTVNGKFYIGKRKHPNPEKDSYLGSGKLIKEAVVKYGREAFNKEIIEVFETDAEAAALESKLVTKETTQDPNCYNMHEGGAGGFAHINNISKEERPNIKAYKQKVASGEITVGGTQNWSEESWKRVREQGEINRRTMRGGEGFDGWAKMPERDREQRRKEMSEQSRGELNSQFGKHVYIDPTYEGETPSSSVLNKYRFFEGEQPIGWIRIQEWRRNKKKRTGAFGKAWFNDGVQNFFLDPCDDRAKYLKRGRLGKIGQKNSA